MLYYKDSSVIIWNLQANAKKSKTSFKLNLKGVSSLVVASDNKYIIFGSKEGDLFIWSFENKILEAAFKPHMRSVISNTH